MSSLDDTAPPPLPPVDDDDNDEKDADSEAKRLERDYRRRWHDTYRLPPASLHKELTHQRGGAGAKSIMELMRDIQRFADGKTKVYINGQPRSRENLPDYYVYCLTLYKRQRVQLPQKVVRFREAYLRVRKWVQSFSSHMTAIATTQPDLWGSMRKMIVDTFKTPPRKSLAVLCYVKQLVEACECGGNHPVDQRLQSELMSLLPGRAPDGYKGVRWYLKEGTGDKKHSRSMLQKANMHMGRIRGLVAEAEAGTVSLTPESQDSNDPRGGGPRYSVAVGLGMQLPDTALPAQIPKNRRITSAGLASKKRASAIELQHGALASKVTTFSQMVPTLQRLLDMLEGHFAKFFVTRHYIYWWKLIRELLSYLDDESWSSRIKRRWSQVNLGLSVQKAVELWSIVMSVQVNHARGVFAQEDELRDLERTIYLQMDAILGDTRPFRTSEDRSSPSSGRANSVADDATAPGIGDASAESDDSEDMKDAKLFWFRSFGLMCFNVHKKTFTKALRLFLQHEYDLWPQISPTLFHSLITETMGCSGSEVSVVKPLDWVLFMYRYGPLKACIDKAMGVCVVVEKRIKDPGKSKKKQTRKVARLSRWFKQCSKDQALKVLKNNLRKARISQGSRAPNQSSESDYNGSGRATPVGGGASGAGSLKGWNPSTRVHLSVSAPSLALQAAMGAAAASGGSLGLPVPSKASPSPSTSPKPDASPSTSRKTRRKRAKTPTSSNKKKRSRSHPRKTAKPKLEKSKTSNDSYDIESLTDDGFVGGTSSLAGSLKNFGTGSLSSLYADRGQDASIDTSKAWYPPFLIAHAVPHWRPKPRAATSSPSKKKKPKPARKGIRKTGDKKTKKDSLSSNGSSTSRRSSDTRVQFADDVGDYELFLFQNPNQSGVSNNRVALGYNYRVVRQGDTQMYFLEDEGRRFHTLRDMLIHLFPSQRPYLVKEKYGWKELWSQQQQGYYPTVNENDRRGSTIGRLSAHFLDGEPEASLRKSSTEQVAEAVEHFETYLNITIPAIRKILPLLPLKTVLQMNDLLYADDVKELQHGLSEMSGKDPLAMARYRFRGETVAHKLVRRALINAVQCWDEVSVTIKEQNQVDHQKVLRSLEQKQRTQSAHSRNASDVSDIKEQAEHSLELRKLVEEHQAITTRMLSNSLQRFDNILQKRMRQWKQQWMDIMRTLHNTSVVLDSSKSRDFDLLHQMRWTDGALPIQLVINFVPNAPSPSAEIPIRRFAAHVESAKRAIVQVLLDRWPPARPDVHILHYAVEDAASSCNSALVKTLVENRFVQESLYSGIGQRTIFHCLAEAGSSHADPLSFYSTGKLTWPLLTEWQISENIGHIFDSVMRVLFPRLCEQKEAMSYEEELMTKYYYDESEEDLPPNWRKEQHIRDGRLQPCWINDVTGAVLHTKPEHVLDEFLERRFDDMTAALMAAQLGNVRVLMKAKEWGASLSAVNPHDGCNIIHYMVMHIEKYTTQELFQLFILPGELANLHNPLNTTETAPPQTTLAPAFNRQVSVDTGVKAVAGKPANGIKPILKGRRVDRVRSRSESRGKGHLLQDVKVDQMENIELQNMRGRMGYAHSVEVPGGQHRRGASGATPSSSKSRDESEEKARRGSMFPRPPPALLSEESRVLQPQGTTYTLLGGTKARQVSFARRLTFLPGKNAGAFLSPRRTDSHFGASPTQGTDYFGTLRSRVNRRNELNVSPLATAIELYISSSPNRMRHDPNAAQVDLPSRARRRLRRLVLMLLEQGASLNSLKSANDPAKSTILVNTMMELTLTAMARSEEICWLVLRNAVFHGDEELVEHVLRLAPKYDLLPYIMNPFLYVHSNEVKRREYSEDASAILPFVYANYEYHIRFMLLQDASLLHMAVRLKQPKIVKLLLDHTPSPSERHSVASLRTGRSGDFLVFRSRRKVGSRMLSHLSSSGTLSSGSGTPSMLTRESTQSELVDMPRAPSFSRRSVPVTLHEAKEAYYDDEIHQDGGRVAGSSLTEEHKPKYSRPPSKDPQQAPLLSKVGVSVPVHRASVAGVPRVANNHFEVKHNRDRSITDTHVVQANSQSQRPSTIIVDKRGVQQQEQKASEEDQEEVIKIAMPEYEDRYRAFVADINFVDEFGFTALHLAANVDAGDLAPVSGGHTAVNRASSFKRSVTNYGGMHGGVDAAEYRNNEDIALSLLKRKIDFTVLDENAWTALHYASLNNQIDIVKMLIKRHVDVEQRIDANLAKISQVSQLSRQFAMSPKASFTARAWGGAGDSRGHSRESSMDSEEGCWERFKRMLGCLCWRKSMAASSSFPDRGRARSRIQSAQLFQRQFTSGALLLRNGPGDGGNTDDDDNMAELRRLWEDHERRSLHLAAGKGHWQVVASLLRAGAKVDILDSRGNTPLTLAMIANRKYQRLLERIVLQRKLHSAAGHIVHDRQHARTLSSSSESDTDGGDETGPLFRAGSSTTSVEDLNATFHEWLDADMDETMDRLALVTAADKTLSEEQLQYRIKQYRLTISTLLNNGASISAATAKFSTGLGKLVNVGQEWKRIQAEVSFFEDKLQDNEERFANGKSTAEQHHQKSLVYRQQKFEFFMEKFHQIIIEYVYKTQVRPRYKARMLRYFVFLLLLTLLGVYESTGDEKSAFWTYQTFTNTLINDEFPLNVSQIKRTFPEIDSKQEFWLWLKGVFVETMYADAPKYWDEFNETSRGKGFFNDQSRILGVPRLRQIRSITQSCQVASEFDSLVSPCFSPVVSHEDTTTWGLRNDPQIWQSEGDLHGIRVWGRAGFYEGSGYVVQMPPFSDDSSAHDIARGRVQALEDMNWIDSKTRVVFVETTLLNANEEHFVYAVAMVEFPLTGGVVPSFEFLVLRLKRYMSVGDWFVGALEIVVTAIMIGRIVVIVRQLHFQGRGFLRSIYNVLDIAMALIYVAVAVIHVTTVLWELDVDWQATDHFPTRSSRLARWVQLENKGLSLFVLLSWFKLLDYLRVFKKLSRSVVMIEMTIKQLVYFLILFTIVLAAFASAEYIAYGYQDPQAFTWLYGFLTKISDAFSGRSIAPKHTERDRVLGTFYGVLFVLVVNMLLLNLIIAIMTTGYEQARNESGATYWAKRQYSMITTEVEGVFDVCCDGSPKRNKKKKERKSTEESGGCFPRWIASCRAKCRQRRKVVDFVA